MNAGHIAAAEGPGVAVIGGGWAGCAAALTLAHGDCRVSLLEQAPVLGGRARRVAIDGLALDNGQHLLLGAYAETLRLIAQVHSGPASASLFSRLPLALSTLPEARAAVSLRAGTLPAPLNLVAALLTARGLDWRGRIGLATSLHRLRREGFRVDPDTDVATRFADVPPPAFAAVLAPLCFAALNTAPGEASARVFAAVLREAFFTRRSASDFLLARTDLASIFPDAAARHVVGTGGSVAVGSRVHDLATGEGSVRCRVGGEPRQFAAAIVAVGPHQLKTVFGPELAATPGCASALAEVAGFRYEPIATVYLGFAKPVRLPAPVTRLDDAPGQWAFDRADIVAAAGGAPAALVSVVISAHGPHEALPHDRLAMAVEGQLRRLSGRLPPVTWSRVIDERRATYACTPGLPRPVAGRIAPGIYLAGDYTDPEFPATLEAATRSGTAAARALLADLRR